MTVFLLGSFSVALAFVPVIVSQDPHQIEIRARQISQPVGAICLILVSASCLYFITQRKRWEDSGKVHFRQEQQGRNQDHGRNDNDEAVATFANTQQGIPMLQMIVFGIGASLFMLCSTIHTIMFEEKDTYRMWMTTLDEIFYLPSIAVQVIFFIKYDGAFLPNWSLFHYSIALMIADKIWVWLTVTLADIALVSSENITTQSDSFNSTFHYVIDSSLVFLQPFFMEFLTVAMGVLFRLWSNIGKYQREEHIEPADDGISNPNIQQDNNANVSNAAYISQMTRDCDIDDEVSSEITEQQSLLRSASRNSTKVLQVSERAKTILFIAFAFVISMGLLLNVLILEHIPPFQHIAVSLSGRMQYNLHFGFLMSVYLPVTITCIFTSYKIYQTNNCMTVHLATADYVLLFTAAANFIWFIFRLIAGINFLSTDTENRYRDEAAFLICYAIVCIFQVWTQTQMLLASRCVQQLGRRNTNFARFCLILLAAINVPLWLTIAIGRKSVIWQEHSISVFFLSESFGPASSKTLLLLSYPAMELYRFHSAVVAYDILK